MQNLQPTALIESSSPSRKPGVIGLLKVLDLLGTAGLCYLFYIEILNIEGYFGKANSDYIISLVLAISNGVLSFLLVYSSVLHALNDKRAGLVKEKTLGLSIISLVALALFQGFGRETSSISITLKGLLYAGVLCSGSLELLITREVARGSGDIRRNP